MESLDLFGGKHSGLLNENCALLMSYQKERFQSNDRNVVPHEYTLAMRLCSHGEGVQ